jgi:hypothetical protein
MRALLGAMTTGKTARHGMFCQGFACQANTGGRNQLLIQ